MFVGVKAKVSRKNEHVCDVRSGQATNVLNLLLSEPFTNQSRDQSFETHQSKHSVLRRNEKIFVRPKIKDRPKLGLVDLLTIFGSKFSKSLNHDNHHSFFENEARHRHRRAAGSPGRSRADTTGLSSAGPCGDAASMSLTSKERRLGPGCINGSPGLVDQTSCDPVPS